MRVTENGTTFETFEPLTSMINLSIIFGEQDSGLRHSNENQTAPSSNPTRPGLKTQPFYDDPSHLQVKIVENTMINISLVRLFPQEQPKFCLWDSQIAI